MCDCVGAADQREGVAKHGSRVCVSVSEVMEVTSVTLQGLFLQADKQLLFQFTVKQR